MTRKRSWLVPGHPRWRARRVKRHGVTVAVRARHRIAPWRSITVDSADLRAGGEAIARQLSHTAWQARVARERHRVIGT